MKKIYLFLSGFLVTFFFSQGQITVDDQDFPEPGDTIRSSTTILLDGIDYEATGEGYVWDFSSLTLTGQQVDTFESVSQTPLLYQLVFNSFFDPEHRATVAQKIINLDFIPGLEITDPYMFYKKSGDDYREVGFGVTYTGIPVPVAYENVDVMYRFPMNYGNIDSSQSDFAISFPGLGYYGSSRFRKNEVEGWGTLMTPYGEFDVLKVKTFISQYDSIYLDTIGAGFPISRQITEYKWIGKGYRLPLVTVRSEGLITTVTYIDSLRNSFTSAPELQASGFEVKVFPNPCSDYISVNYELTEQGEVEIDLYSLYGDNVMKILNKTQVRGIYSKVIYLRDEGVRPGVYIMRIAVNGMPSLQRIIVR